MLGVRCWALDVSRSRQSRYSRQARNSPSQIPGISWLRAPEGTWNWCRWWDSNPHDFLRSQDFKSCASAISPHRHSTFNDLRGLQAGVSTLLPGFASRAAENYKTTPEFANKMAGSFSARAGNLRRQPSPEQRFRRCRGRVEVLPGSGLWSPAPWFLPK